jgi:hypothetical protein
MAIAYDSLLEIICLFAGVAEHKRTSTTLWIRLCMAEVRGSNPLLMPHELEVLDLGSHLSPSQGTGIPFSGYTRSLTIVPHLANYRRKRRALVMGNAENGRNKDVVLALLQPRVHSFVRLDLLCRKLESFCERTSSPASCSPKCC